MLRSRNKLIEYLTEECVKVNRNKNTYLMKDKVNALVKIYEVPETTAIDLITLKTNLEYETDYVLFIMLKVFDNNLIFQYFTNTEINTYEKTKYEVNKVKFPLYFDMIEIKENQQWIGSISTKRLMQFRDAQLIRYNENTQRVMRQKKKGNAEYYSIALNKKAIKSMMDLFKKGTYIPNTITLNMPEEADYYYKDGQLVIKDIDAFDILDGYHRYISISNMYNLDSSFEYNMELRIVYYSEDKAKQFIWQEDQKTKMSRIDSDSFNQNNAANQIAEMLNQTGLLAGQITSKEGLVNYADLAKAIDVVYSLKKINSRSEIIKIKNSVKDAMQLLCDVKPEMLDNVWTSEDIAFLVVYSKYKKSDDILKEFDKMKEISIKENLNYNRGTFEQNVRRIKNLY